ncbi:helix-turn-helix transcriptional regulator [Calothrix sp. UHCC 0171]|uniref:helix-turn-helix domain-containing protein n=1 Tax=Calothrix sp. UHCC 0171 TaxID=3110245 RepID=UPI002B1ECC56|nr:helix-turn-helix transcriptional regulator [Calothrix sp. UHCC 0171]MEA5569604.1 helix-turn-helix transcriptional regulator [Calothrix sp. UHCC 0171]
MKELILVQFGQKVREERLKQNLSQEQLADKAGVHRTYIGMIERAEKNITLINIGKIAKALEIQIADLFAEL